MNDIELLNECRRRGFIVSIPEHPLAPEVVDAWNEMHPSEQRMLLRMYQGKGPDDGSSQRWPPGETHPYTRVVNRCPALVGYIGLLTEWAITLIEANVPLGTGKGMRRNGSAYPSAESADPRGR